MKLGRCVNFPGQTFSLLAGVVVCFLAGIRAGIGADAGVALHLEIDRLLTAVPGAVGRRPVDDATFLRRVTLDLAGQIPAGHLAAEFLANSAADKRSVLIDRLLGSPAYARNMQRVFDNWLMQRRPARHVSADQWQTYLRESFASNKSWDRLTIEILSADGSDPRTRAVARFYLDRECNTDELARDISGIFLGRNLRCAQCHDHPIVPDYKQSHFFGVAAFVDRSFLFDDKVNKQKVLAEKAEGETAFTSALTQVRGVTAPRILDGPQFVDPALDKDSTTASPPAEGVRPVPAFSRRALLPVALVQHPAFSRNMANRLWALMFGRGIVEPVDLDHDGNPPTHPELLQLLAERFVLMKYDIRAFLRELALTELYASECSNDLSGTESTGTQLTLNLRKLTPEQLAWSWLQATGYIDAESQLLVSEQSTSAATAIADATVTQSAREAKLHDRLVEQADKVIKVFVTSLPGETSRSETTAPQALYLLNGTTLRQWISQRPGNLLDRLVQETSDERLARELFLNVLSRPPDANEIRWVHEALAASAAEPETAASDTSARRASEGLSLVQNAERVTVISDLIESLLTSTEFRFNR